jgi:two-component system response regulator MprA
MRPTVLIVEDDADLRSVVVRALDEEGFEAAAVTTGAALLERLETSDVDLLVIDIGLPDADGRDVCQALRARGVRTPVLFLTAFDALPDRLSGFRSGGDDYVTKPFAVAEVAERLRALLRRSDAVRGLELDGLRLDPAAHAAVRGDRSVPLTPTEFRLLAALLARPGEAVRRASLIDAGWPHGAIVHANTLDVFIARLRRKLRELGAELRLETVHGVGYKAG